MSPLWSLRPEQGTLIGIAGRTDNLFASTQRNGMDRGRGKREEVRGRWRRTETKESGWVEVERMGEREFDKSCIIAVSLALAIFE